MSQMLITLAVSLFAGLLMSRVAKKVGFPAVTGYLLAGLALGPFCIGAFGLDGLGFSSLDNVKSFSIISQFALGIIAFTIGNEFRLKDLKSMGKQAFIVGISEAVGTTVVVDISLIIFHFIRPDIMSLSSAVTLGAIAAATAPAATIMVVRQYKSEGPLTKLLLMVVALDDAVGLILFAISFGIATAIESGEVNVIGIVVEPLLELVLSVALGSLTGLVFTLLERFFHSRSKRLALACATIFLTVGIALLKFRIGSVNCSFSLLLTCMISGTFFCNMCEASEELMGRFERWSEPVKILFFVLSGAELDLKILRNPVVLIVGFAYIVMRIVGKISGAFVGCTVSKCSATIKKHFGMTLIPQAGVALGMTLTAVNLQGGNMIRNVVLFGVLVYELIGPSLTKRSLLSAGEISIEGKKSSRRLNASN
ncbi:MAG: cation:proton antiporter [Clostridia bacterium]|nr:cation:proton antiporter [Clostridia bacterium]